MLALARNIPQAHASLTDGTLGALEVRRRRGLREDARGARLRPHRPARRRPRARLRDARRRLRPVRLGRALPRARRREGRDARTSSTRRRTSSRSTCPRRPRRAAGWTPRRSRRCSDGVRVINCARGELVDDDGAQGRAGLRQGRGRRARRLPARADHRLPAVRRLPERRRHAAPGRLDDRGAGPRGRADGRAGRGRADRRRRLDRRQHPGGLAEDMEVLGPFLPLVPRLGRARDGARGGLGRRPRRGRVPRPDRRARHAPADARRAQRRARRPHRGGGQPRQRAVAGRGARDRGLRAHARSSARDFTDLVRVTSSRGDERTRVVGTTLGRQHRPHLLEAWGQRFNLQIDEGTSRCSATATCRAWSAASAPRSASTA